MEATKERQGTYKVIMGEVKKIKEAKVAKRGADLAGQTLAGELESVDAEWWCRGALDTIPPTKVGIQGPIAQGSRRVPNALLEIEQCLQIYSVLTNC